MMRSALLAALCVACFWAVGLAYGGFPIPQGVGVQDIHPAELVFSAWYLVLGIPALFFATHALYGSRLPDAALGAARRAAVAPDAVALAALAAAVLAFAVRALVIQFAPVADDESTYVFIARTLLEGRLANPAPEDAAFFGNQFVVLDSGAWYGKYPIGHPLVLAVGEALSARALVGPLLAAAALALTFAAGRIAFSRDVALLGAGLLLVSPQFLSTGATDLSQTTSGVCLLGALYALLRLDAGAGQRCAVLAGASLGFGVLARPMPGLLIAAVAGVWVLLRFQDEPWERQLRRLAAGAAPLVGFGALLFAVQLFQTGDAARSTYDAAHGGHYGGFFRLDWIGASLAGALLRQNFWLFGWPLSFLFLPFARRDRGAALVWAMLLAVYAYRIAVPKTVVATTGPVYVAEAVPLLVLLTASGMRAAAQRFSPRAVAAVALAGIAISAVTFLPIQLRTLHRTGSAWQTANRLLDEAGAHHALIFANELVHPSSGRSWAYYPPNPSPDLSDERLFVRIPLSDDTPARVLDFWLRRFPERRAFVFVFDDEGRPILQPLRRPRAQPAGAPPGGPS